MTFIAQTETKSTSLYPFPRKKRWRNEGEKVKTNKKQNKNNIFSCKSLEPNFFEKQKQNQREN